MALAGVDEVQALDAIGPRVVEAMDFSLKPDLSDFRTLQDTVAQASASPGFDTWLHALKGYVGEQVAADVLESRGAVVELAGSGSTPRSRRWRALARSAGTFMCPSSHRLSPA